MARTKQTSRALVEYPPDKLLTAVARAQREAWSPAERDARRARLARISAAHAALNTLLEAGDADESSEEIIAARAALQAAEDASAAWHRGTGQAASTGRKLKEPVHKPRKSTGGKAPRKQLATKAARYAGPGVAVGACYAGLDALPAAAECASSSGVGESASAPPARRRTAPSASVVRPRSPSPVLLPTRSGRARRAPTSYRDYDVPAVASSVVCSSAAPLDAVAVRRTRHPAPSPSVSIGGSDCVTPPEGGVFYHRPFMADIVSSAAAAASAAPAASCGQVRCPLALGAGAGCAFTCDVCQVVRPPALRRFSCIAHNVDVCFGCTAGRTHGEYEIVVTTVSRGVPRDAWGRPTLRPEEFTRLTRSGNPDVTDTRYRVLPTSLVHLWDGPNRVPMILVRVDFAYNVSDRHASSGVLLDADLEATSHWPSVSALHMSDPLAHRSHTCWSCGPTILSAYFCQSSACLRSSCYDCYSRARWPSAAVMHPSAAVWQLPAPLPCSELLCGPRVSAGVIAEHDQSYVTVPTTVVSVLGLDGPAPDYLADDFALVRGVSIFPIDVACDKPVRGGVRSNTLALLMARLATARALVATIDAEQLVLHVMGHSRGGVYYLGALELSPLALLDEVIRPLVTAFRASFARARNPRVLVVLSVCDVDAAVWGAFVADEPPESAFALLAFSNALPIVKVAPLASTLLRSMMNRLTTSQDGWDLSHAVAHMLARHGLWSLRPVLHRPGCAALYQFAAYVPRPPMLLAAGSTASTSVTALSYASPVPWFPSPALSFARSVASAGVRLPSSGLSLVAAAAACSSAASLPLPVPVSCAVSVFEPSPLGRGVMASYAASVCVPPSHAVLAASGAESLPVAALSLDVGVALPASVVSQASETSAQRVARRNRVLLAAVRQSVQTMPSSVYLRLSADALLAHLSTLSVLLGFGAVLTTTGYCHWRLRHWCPDVVPGMLVFRTAVAPVDPPSVVTQPLPTVGGVP